MTDAVAALTATVERLRLLIATLESRVKVLTYTLNVTEETMNSYYIEDATSLQLGGPHTGTYHDTFATASAESSIVADSSVVVGPGTGTVSVQDSIVVGPAGTGTAERSVMMSAGGSEVNMTDSIVLGGATVKGPSNEQLSRVITLGQEHEVQYPNSVAIGVANRHYGPLAMTLGTQNVVDANYSAAIGTFGAASGGLSLCSSSVFPAGIFPTLPASSWVKYGRPHAPNGCVRVHGDGGVQITVGAAEELQVSKRPVVNLPAGSARAGGGDELVTENDVRALMRQEVFVNHQGTWTNNELQTPGVNPLAVDTLDIIQEPSGAGMRYGPFAIGTELRVCASLALSQNNFELSTDGLQDHGIMRAELNVNRGGAGAPNGVAAVGYAEIRGFATGSNVGVDRSDAVVSMSFISELGNQFLWISETPSTDGHVDYSVYGRLNLQISERRFVDV